MNNYSAQKKVLHRSGWVIVDSETIIKDGYVVVESGVIKDVGHGRVKTNCPKTVNHGPGVLMPPLINVHTHLELGAMKGEIPEGLDFIQWIQEVVERREYKEESEILKGIEEGVRELVECGCLVAGEISSLGLSRDILVDSVIEGVWFREIIGNTIPDLIKSQTMEMENEILFSMAGHAPHTTSPTVLKKLKHLTLKKNLPFSIHLAESDDEVEFLRTGKGRWADFLCQRGFDISKWGLPVGCPVQYVENIGVLDSHTIVVHLIKADQIDLEKIRHHNCHVCVCPRSNKNLHKKLPNISGMLNVGIKPCVGTDSSASTATLDLFDEMRFIATEFPDIQPSDIIAMATENGAKALNLNHRFGSLVPGKRGSFVYVPVETTYRKNLLEYVVNKEFIKPVKLLLCEL